MVHTSNNLVNVKSRSFPLMLQDMGSFYIGGRKVQVENRGMKKVTLTNGGEPVEFDLDQTFHTENMYVQYFIPAEIKGKFPLLLWHGGGLTGAFYETTPDGRSGWLNYFINKGWIVYNSDAVE